MSRHHGYVERRRGLQGEDLQSLLQRGWAPMPQKTIVTLVLSGLRVRLMRSVVTMVSIVLAIAFLTYMGLSEYLYTNVSQDAKDRDSYSPVSADVVGAAVADLLRVDLFGSLPMARQQQLAKGLGYDRTDEQVRTLIELRKQRRDAANDLSKKREQKIQVDEDAESRPIDKELAAKRVNDAAAKVVRIEEQMKALDQIIDLAEWMRLGDRHFDDELAQLTELQTAFTAVENDTATRSQTRAVTRAQDLGTDGESLAKQIGQMQQRKKGMPQVLLGTLERFAHKDRQKGPDGLLDLAAVPSRLEDDQLDQLAVLLDLATEQKQAVAAAATLRQMLGQERLKRDAAKMNQMLRRAGINVESQLKGDPMSVWLITMALLTCTVGIANAMLMSVTERFREIGTMKCLGAQDWLVVRLFLLESGFLGVIGGAMGIVLGVIVALLGAVLQFKGFGVVNFPFNIDQGMLVIALSVLAGMVLSVIGAGYPAMVAARMQPVDALRVEE